MGEIVLWETSFFIQDGGMGTHGLGVESIILDGSRRLDTIFRALAPASWMAEKEGSRRSREDGARMFFDPLTGSILFHEDEKFLPLDLLLDDADLDLWMAGRTSTVRREVKGLQHQVRRGTFAVCTLHLDDVRTAKRFRCRANSRRA